MVVFNSFFNLEVLLTTTCVATHVLGKCFGQRCQDHIEGSEDHFVVMLDFLSARASVCLSVCLS